MIYTPTRVMLLNERPHFIPKVDEESRPTTMCAVILEAARNYQKTGDKK